MYLTKESLPSNSKRYLHFKTDSINEITEILRMYLKEVNWTTKN